MQPFEYLRPDSLSAASDLLLKHGEVAAMLAGGTDLIVQMQGGTRKPETVVDLKRVRDLSGEIEDAGSSLRIGALATMADVAAHPRVLEHFPALAEAARSVGSVQVRNRATLAGNICNASPAADTAPPLLVYGVRVNVFGPAERRTVPIGEFFVGPARTILARGEIVESVDLPYPSGPVGSSFLRISRRRGMDLASVNVACLVGASGHAVFAFGAVGPTPILATDDSGALLDEGADAEAKDAALRRLTGHARPISDIRAGEKYRRAMVFVLARRALATASDRLKRRT